MTDDERFEGAEGRDEELGEGYKWEEEPDLTSSPVEELRVHLEELSAEERALSLSHDEALARVLLEERRRGGGVS
jgi:hypothetical protein